MVCPRRKTAEYKKVVQTINTIDQALVDKGIIPAQEKKPLELSSWQKRNYSRLKAEMELNGRLAQTKSRIDQKLKEIDQVMNMQDRVELQGGESLALDDRPY